MPRFTSPHSPASAPRIHRLPPHKRDYSLIPAPLDLSLPLATEKSPLPAIIVTPCSPSSSQDFAIAFLAPPAPPSLYERISLKLSSFKSTKTQNHNHNQSVMNARTRAFLIVFLIVFVLICHVVTHRLASRHSVFDFAPSQQHDVVGMSVGTSPSVASAESETTGPDFVHSIIEWFDLPMFFGQERVAVPRDFVVDAR